MCVGALVAFVAACSSDASTAGRRALGTIEVVAVWQDVEARRFSRVLGAFEDATGAVVQYTSTAGEDIEAVVDRRLASGDPPELAILPQPGLLRRYARRGVIVPVGGVVGDAAESWSREWRRLASVDGRSYGIWFKAAHKSLVWYDLATFERVGVVPPGDLDDLVTVAETISATGTPAFALAGEDQWTLTDWFENVYLRQAGPERYDALSEHRIPWTDASVVETLSVLRRLFAPPIGTGVAEGIANTSFEEAVALVFGSGPPAAAMVMEGDFVGGVITGSTRSEIGVDADVFTFPDVDPSRRLVVAGGDVVVMLRSTAASRALLRYLAMPAAAEVWAALGGFVSANEDVDLSGYRDPVAAAVARSLVEAGDGFRFDLSDLQPPAFGSTTGAGLFGVLAEFASDPADVTGTAARLEAAAAEAYAALTVAGGRAG